jgi:hypothetical protein
METNYAPTQEDDFEGADELDSKIRSGQMQISVFSPGRVNSSGLSVGVNENLSNLDQYSNEREFEQ